MVPGEDEMNTLHPSAVLAACLSVILMALAVDLVLADDIDQVFQEGHSIEAAAAVLLFAAAVLWLVTRWGRAGLSDWPIPVALVLMGMRELDFDKSFTTKGILHMRLYTGSAPVLEKLVGLVVICVILALLYQLVRVFLRPWLANLRAGRAPAWVVAVALVLMVGAKSVDGLGRKLGGFGIEVSDQLLSRVGRIEEILELVFALLLVQAIVWRDSTNGSRALKVGEPKGMAALD
jgi:hypothetical protein